MFDNIISYEYSYGVPDSCDSNMNVNKIAFKQKSTKELFKERCELYNKPIPKFIKENEKQNAEIKLVLELTLNLKNADTGSAQVYFF